MEKRGLTRLKKKAQEEGRLIIYVDEAGINLLASEHRTYSQKGKTPILENACKYKHLSVASGISEAGDLIYQIQEESFKGEGIVDFVRKITEEIKGKLLLIWDGAKIHRSEAMKKYLNEQQNDHVWLVKIPPYSPELNADEQVWNYIKHIEMKNVCCKGITELKMKVINVLENLKRKKELIQNFFKHPKVGFY